MAYISSTWNTTNTYIKYRLVVDLLSQDINANTSTINVQLQAWRTNTGYTTYGTGTSSVNVEGSQHNQGISSSQTITYNSYTVLYNANHTISHNADGTKSPNIGGYFIINSIVNGGWNYFSFALPTIPRASTVSATDANIEATTSINIGRYSTSFTHTLEYAFGSLTGTIATGVETSYGWTVPSSFYAQIPNALSGTCTVTCKTYNGATLIGTSQTTFAANVNQTTNKPDVSATIVDSNSTTVALTGDSSKFVKYISNAQFSITATAKNSSTITSRSIVCGGLSSTSASGTLTGVESGTFVVSATDSRSIPNSATYNKALVEYVNLSINTNLYRTQPTNNQIGITYSGNYFNGSFGAQANTLTVKYRYREAGTSTWSSYTTITPTISGSTYSGSQNLSQTFDYTRSYEFEVVAIDKVYTSGVISAKNVSQGIPVFNWDRTSFKTNVATTVPALTATTINGGDAIIRKYIGTSQNINDYKTAGQYSFYGTNTNAPTTDISTLEVIVYSPDWLLQRWTSMSSGTIWERRWHSATTWSAWNKTINATETVYLPVDFNVFRLTSQTRVNGTGIFPITKISGKLTISSNWIVLPGGYAYEFIMDFALGNAINGAVAMNLKNTIDQITLARRNIIHTTTWGDPYSNATGYGFSDLTSLSGSDSLKVITEYFGGDPYVMSEQGGLYIKVYKKITI